MSSAGADGTGGRLDRVYALIDAANAHDPTPEDGRPAALVYGERMTREAARLVPEASDVLKIAARGQHVERWLLPRGDYPDGKQGYLAWRREQGRRHAVRVAGMMAEAGCGDPVTLPLPVGTVVPPNPFCGSGFNGLEGVAEQGMQWLRGLIN